MDPRQLFVDERLTGVCAYCFGTPDTHDHVPSRVLLDDPLPENLPVVKACKACNEGFSQDEEYVACIVECALTGSCEPVNVRPKIKRILEKRPAIAALMAQCRTELDGNLIWQPDCERVKHILLKLAQGHMAYELSLPALGLPESIGFAPLISMSENNWAKFESGNDDSSNLWPEIGSRAFERAALAFGTVSEPYWIVVQDGRYRYHVDQNRRGRKIVEGVLSEYLAFQVAWK
jgi:hypothetical protein